MGFFSFFNNNRRNIRRRRRNKYSDSGGNADPVESEGEVSGENADPVESEEEVSRLWNEANLESEDSGGNADPVESEEGEVSGGLWNNSANLKSEDSGENTVEGEVSGLWNNSEQPAGNWNNSATEAGEVSRFWNNSANLNTEDEVRDWWESLQRQADAEQSTCADPEGELKEELEYNLWNWKDCSNPMVSLSDEEKLDDDDDEGETSNRQELDDDDSEELDVETSNRQELDFKEYKLPNKKERKNESKIFPPLGLEQMRRKRMEDISYLLNNSELFKLENKKRRDAFTFQFISDFSFVMSTSRYSVQKLVELLGAQETILMFCSLTSDLCICINQLKTSVHYVIQFLEVKKINSKPISWCHDSLVTSATNDDLRRLKLYKQGCYTILKSSNMLLPVMTLEPHNMIEFVI